MIFHAHSHYVVHILVQLALFILGKLLNEMSEAHCHLQQLRTSNNRNKQLNKAIVTILMT